MILIKNVIGKVEDETGACIPSLFIGVRSKVYTMEAYLPSFYDKLSVKEQKSLMKKKMD